jgi:hypothetical protein
VVRYNGQEIGRIAADALNAADRVAELARQYGGVQVEHVAEECVDLLGSQRRRSTK